MTTKINSVSMITNILHGSESFHFNYLGHILLETIASTINIFYQLDLNNSYDTLKNTISIEYYEISIVRILLSTLNSI